MASLLLAVIYLAFISLGLPDSLLGAGWPAMHISLGASLSSAGLISMIISFGTIISSLLSERMTLRFTTKRVTLFCVLLTACAMMGFSLSKSFTMLCLFAIPYGLGAGSIDAALNNYIALHYSSRHMSWLHCFWGVGTIVSPYVMSAAVAAGRWQLGYRNVSLIQFAIAAILFVTLPIWKVHEKHEEGTDGVSASGNAPEPIGLRRSLSVKGVPRLLAGFFGYCAAEATFMVWSGTYFAEVNGIDNERAAALASMFFIGITVGRFLSGLISNRMGDRRMIRLGAVILFIGIAMLALFGRYLTLSISALVIIGLGCAPIYPSIIHSTPSNFGADKSQAIIGVQMAAAYIGSTFAPPLFGLLAKATGMNALAYYCGAIMLLMIIMVDGTFKITADHD